MSENRVTPALTGMTPQDFGTLPEWARGWPNWIQPYLRPEMASMLFLGFASGLPLYLVFQKTSFWLREEGVALSTIGFFFWVGMFYSFKFVWAPVADKLKIPVLTNFLGQRRSWMIVAIVGTVIALLIIATSDPGPNQIGQILAGALLLSFSGATLDVSIDAWRIESAPSERQANMAASYSLGYRGALIFSNTGFVIAGWLSWPAAFVTMGMAMAATGALVLLIKEPPHQKPKADIDKLPFFAGPWNAIAVATALFALCRVLKFFGLDYQLMDGLFVLAAAVMILGGLILKGTSSPLFLRLALTGAGALFVYASDFAALFAIKSAGGAPVFSLLVLMISLMSVAVYGRLVYEAVTGGMRRVGMPPGEETPRGKMYVLYATPFLQIWERYGKIIIPIFIFVMIYRTSDFTMGVMAIPLYADLGYEKALVGIFQGGPGVFATFIGLFIGGFVANQIGVMRSLIIGGILTLLTNGAYAWFAHSIESVNLMAGIGAMSIKVAHADLIPGLGQAGSLLGLSGIDTATLHTMGSALYLPGAGLPGVDLTSLDPVLAAVTGEDSYHGPNRWALLAAICADNVAGGFVTTVFIAYLSSLVDPNYAATQYALFSSVYAMANKFVAGFSGVMAQAVGYAWFFLITASYAIPGILLVLLIMRMQKSKGEDGPASADASPEPQPAS